MYILIYTSKKPYTGPVDDLRGSHFPCMEDATSAQPRHLQHLSSHYPNVGRDLLPLIRNT